MFKPMLDWEKLTLEEKKFVLRVEESNGQKYAAEPYCDDKGNYFYEKCEELGFVKCVGSYKFIITEKFEELLNQKYDDEED